jgi:ATP-dependent protease ClpP protease subunit
MNRTWHSVNIDPDGTAFIRVEGTVGCFGDDGSETLRAVADAQKIHCVICSGGGDSGVAVKWFEHLKERKPDVHITGRACSAAAIIAMAGKRRSIEHDAQIMVHAPMRGVLGNRKQLLFAADSIGALQERFAQILCEGTGQPPSVIEGWLGADTWMTAEEAVSAGFAHEIVPPLPQTLYQIRRAAEIEAGRPTGDTDEEKLCFDMLNTFGKIPVRDVAAFAFRLSYWAHMNAQNRI